MTCQTFESVVNDLARQQMMEASARDQALAHTEECGVCALRLADERALTQRLRDVTSEMSELDAPARIEEELLAAFRNQKSTEQFSRQGRSRNGNSRFWATAAAAAILLTVIGIVAMSMRPSPAPVATENSYTPPLRPGVAGIRSSAQPPPSIVVPETTEPSPHKTALASFRPRRHPKSPATHSNSRGNGVEPNALLVDGDSNLAANYWDEIATDFMPVGYASPMSLQDGGQVMRVELPRSALAGFGLPVNMDRVNERVKADVLVGTDGQARAIRFVQ